MLHYTVQLTLPFKDFVSKKVLPVSCRYIISVWIEIYKVTAVLGSKDLLSYLHGRFVSRMLFECIEHTFQFFSVPASVFHRHQL